MSHAASVQPKETQIYRHNDGGMRIFILTVEPSGAVVGLWVVERARMPQRKQRWNRRDWLAFQKALTLIRDAS
jgi:hypothetical protein